MSVVRTIGARPVRIWSDCPGAARCRQPQRSPTGGGTHLCCVSCECSRSSVRSAPLPPTNPQQFGTDYCSPASDKPTAVQYTLLFPASDQPTAVQYRLLLPCLQPAHSGPVHIIVPCLRQAHSPPVQVVTACPITSSPAHTHHSALKWISNRSCPYSWTWSRYAQNTLKLHIC